jgi:CHAD domain-containing protein
MKSSSERSPAPLAGAHVSKKLRELDTALTATLPRVVDARDDEAIHDMRVAIRRLRTLLKMARRLFGPWHTDVVRRSFADVMRATGDLRDEEVLEETLAQASEHPDFVAWVGARKIREQRLHRAVVTRIERGDLDRSRLMLKALLVFPVDPERDSDLARFARKTVERARRKVEGKRDVEVSDVVGMHDLRIAYKELRYSIELLSDALPIDARAQLEPATVFQKRLGEIHDVDVAIEVLTRAKGMPVEVRDEGLIALRALREKRVGKYLRELDPLGALRAKQAAEDAKAHEAQAHEANGAPASLPEGDEPSGEDAPTVHLQRR